MSDSRKINIRILYEMKVRIGVAGVRMIYKYFPSQIRSIWQVLADYQAMSERELTLHEQETVELLKTGCAGWWYVRNLRRPFKEGWAPSTYLIKLPD